MIVKSQQVWLRWKETIIYIPYFYKSRCLQHSVLNSVVTQISYISFKLVVHTMICRLRDSIAINLISPCEICKSLPFLKNEIDDKCHKSSKQCLSCNHSFETIGYKMFSNINWIDLMESELGFTNSECLSSWSLSQPYADWLVETWSRVFI